MFEHWTPECRDMLRLARVLSKELGHHEIVTLEHVFFAAAMVVHGVDREQINAVAAKVFPPWDPNGCFLSPGGQTPSLKRALRHAESTVASQYRRVTTRDVWNSLPHGNAESTTFLCEQFSIAS